MCLLSVLSLIFTEYVLYPPPILPFLFVSQTTFFLRPSLFSPSFLPSYSPSYPPSFLRSYPPSLPHPPPPPLPPLLDDFISAVTALSLNKAKEGERVDVRAVCRSVTLRFTASLPVRLVLNDPRSVPANSTLYSVLLFFPAQFFFFIIQNRLFS